MKQSDHEINNVIKGALHQSTPNTSFEALWNTHSRKDQTRAKYRKAALIPLIAVFALFACFSIGYAGLSRLTDNTDLPFADDSAVIGKWQAVDFVNNITDFTPEKRSYSEKLYLNNLVFIKGGKMLDRLDNTNLSYSGSTWTKDFIVNKTEKTASKYEIKEIDGSKYMFMEWKSGDYIFRFMQPKYYVLKQVDAEDYSGYVVSRIEDKIDYTFKNNPEMPGKWESVDFVEGINEFNPEKTNCVGTLILKEINVQEAGRLTIQFENNQTVDTGLSWTNGLIINKDAAAVSKCTIKTIDGAVYMFLEWKSGDYSFRGAKPSYYVLKKAN